MPLFNPDVPDGGGLTIYTTEAQLDDAIEGGIGVALIDNETNWPTVWPKVGTPSQISVRIERYDDGAEVGLTQFLANSLTRQGRIDLTSTLEWFPWGQIPEIPDGQYGADGDFLKLRKQGLTIYGEWAWALSIANAPPLSATAPGTPGDTSYDASYFYICVATNTWKRVAIAAW